MKEHWTGPRYLMRWDYSRDQRLGRDAVTTTHRLAELPIFSDEGLAEILDRYPRKALGVTTMGDNPAHPSQLLLGKLGAHSGLKLIDLIRRGRLCLRIESVATHHQALARIVQRLCREMMECQPGLRTFDHNGDLEISSPTALKYYGIDVQPNVAWQIRGTRTAWMYPAVDPLVNGRTLERIVSSNDSLPLYFEPAFDDLAQNFQQTPGSVLALPQHTPYRVVNDEGLSVTLTTKYRTCESERRNNAHRANRILNRFFPSDRRSLATSGFGSAAKRLLVRVVGNTLAETSCPTMERTFRVDPDSPLCVGPPATTDFTSVSSFPGLPLESSMPAPVGSEN